MKLIGGLGNQMFQYATARNLALKYKQEPVLDISWFSDQSSTDTRRRFELNQCNISAKVTSQTPKLIRTRSPLERRVTKYLLRRATDYLEPRHSFDSTVLKLPQNSFMRGYFQTEKYFLEIRDLLLKELSPAYKLSPVVAKNLELIEGATGSVSVHVRRGDYASNKKYTAFHGLKGADYYSAAIRHIEKLNQPFTIFVFSDDIAWCKRNLKFKQKTVFVEGSEKSFDDIWLMSHCQHNVVANSSYSWWGAWLNQNSSKVVVSPKRWFDDDSIDSSDMIPEAWIRL